MPVECAAFTYSLNRGLASSTGCGQDRFICSSGMIMSFLDTLKNSAVSRVPFLSVTVAPLVLYL